MIYNLLRILMYIPLKIVMILSPKKRRFIEKRLEQDFSFLKSEKPYIWLHCSSVGEINLSDALIKKMLLERDENILISIFTDTGYENAQNKYSKEERIKLIYFPLDCKKELKKILKKIDLKLLILIETEIWPNLIKLASKRGKVILVNGRISDRSFGRYLKFRKILKRTLERIDNYFMQTDIDKERIIAIGANKESVSVVGNLKFDIELQNYSLEEKEELRSIIISEGRKIFVAGSTRTGEDEIILDAFKHLDDYMLIIVPRHLDRIPKIEELISKKNLSYSKYSKLLEGKAKKSDVVIVDKMGVLRKFYSISDVAFVGGTLVNIGGHSLLEPLFYRKTPIFGKYLQNVKDIAEEILKRGIGFKVDNSEDMAVSIKEIDNGHVKNEEIENFFDANKNATQKIMTEINKIIK
ncbi:glycosyltransferase N-terminal domain-containing protein [Fusobacterium sp.]|uniref:3-deoxy-D-manno-octulosonic acid transferase n=1 Tax=Fusobacterium sp. TaxID=68766 RepID=UPI002613D4DA|nr:glycosyltransferase N-terminal domain-containing protein [Fusobacterium sp.]